MARITKWIEAFALSIGAPGLFIIAFLDSSFLSFPEVNDLLIVLMVINHPERMVLYATMATLGSVAGCLALYYVGRRGGNALLQKRFKGGCSNGRRTDAKYARWRSSFLRCGRAPTVQDLVCWEASQISR